MNRKPAIFALIAILILGAGGFFFFRHRDGIQISYRQAAVAKGDIEVTILSTGVVQPKNRLEIKPPIAGRIEQVLVHEGQVVQKGQILAWMSSTERAALLDAARAKGPEEVSRWEQYYKPTPVMAPINGTIILRNIESGQTFNNTDAILVMSDRLSVKAQVDETDLAQIKLEQAAIVSLDAYPNNAIDGVVGQIAYDAKTVNNVTTYEVDVIPKQTPPYMRSGMTANVKFLVASRENVLVVPTEAIQRQGGRSVVKVLDPSDKSQTIDKPIEIGLSDGKQTEVVSGLSEGETLRVAEIKADRPKQGQNPFMPSGLRSGGGRGGGR